MPCTDGGNDDEERRAVAKRSRGLAKALCLMCADTGGPDPADKSDLIGTWYVAHLRADKARCDEEQARVYFYRVQKDAAGNHFAIGLDHPARIAYNDASHRRRVAEAAEREAAMALDDLKE